MAEMTYEQAKKIDKILNHLIEKHNSGNGNNIESFNIASNLAMDEDEVEHFFYLLKYKIEFEGAKVVGIFNQTDSLLALNYNTTKFIDTGRATGLLNRKLKVQKIKP